MLASYWASTSRAWLLAMHCFTKFFCLPKQVHFVVIKKSVFWNYGQLIIKTLCYDNPVKRITMMKWQTGYNQSVFKCNWQNLEAIICDLFKYFCEGNVKFKLAQAYFDCYFPQTWITDEIDRSIVFNRLFFALSDKSSSPFRNQIMAWVSIR